MSTHWTSGENGAVFCSHCHDFFITHGSFEGYQIEKLPIRIKEFSFLKKRKRDAEDISQKQSTQITKGQTRDCTKHISYKGLGNPDFQERSAGISVKLASDKRRLCSKNISGSSSSSETWEDDCDFDYNPTQNVGRIRQKRSSRTQKFKKNLLMVDKTKKQPAWEKDTTNPINPSYCKDEQGSFKKNDLVWAFHSTSGYFYQVYPKDFRSLTFLIQDRLLLIL